MFMVRRGRAMSPREAIRKGAFYLASSHGRHGRSFSRPTLDAAGRHRLAAPAADVDTGDRGMSNDEDSPVFMRVSSLLHSDFADGILDPCFLLRCPIWMRLTL